MVNECHVMVAANEFPAQFEVVVRRVVRLLFHVVAHMYAAHFRQLALLRLHAHLHLTFAHLTALDTRFSLLDHKETEVRLHALDTYCLRLLHTTVYIYVIIDVSLVMIKC